jgi:CHAT domain-containing protein
LKASQNWGNWALHRQSWSQAVEAYQYGLYMAEQLYHNQILRTHIELWLQSAQGLSARATYALAKTGELEIAIEAIEAGRARLLREALERSRKDLEGLLEKGYTNLYERYMDASRRWERLSRMADHGSVLATAPADHTRGNLLPRLGAVQSEINTLVDEIRTIPGYQSFLLSLSSGQIQAVAAYQPLVYLLAIPTGGLALIVQPDAITSIWLDSLTRSTLLEQVVGPQDDPDLGGYLGTYAAWRATEADKNATDEEKTAATNAWMGTLEATAGWLWDACMGEITKAVADEGIKQATLVPSGLLGLLPLHAAWTEDSDALARRHYALDEISFSYAPSAHALHAVHNGASRPANSFLAIDNPDDTLDFSSEEVAAAADKFDESDVLWLAGEAASSERIKEEIVQRDVLHFSTHGLAGFTQPLDSFLLLANRERLALREILEMRLKARLAVLSACETGIPGTKLLDEVVGLPTGFLQAGAAGVIGSLWSVGDASTMMLMARFYELWRGEGLGPPEALRRAQIWMRDTTNGEKETYFKHAIAHYQEPHRMSGTAAREGLKQIRFANPDERSFAHPFYWAAFGYTGV